MTDDIEAPVHVFNDGLAEFAEEVVEETIFDTPDFAPIKVHAKKMLTPEQAAREAQVILAKRQLARKYLLPFVELFRPGYQAGWVHREICEKLEKFLDDCVNGRSPRLMLFMPPRSGKSEIGSRSFPAWALGKYPWLEVIATSYGASLANTFSRKARDIVRDPNYKNIFPDAILDRDNQSVENWLLTQGGGYVAAGVGGPIVGKGAHCLIIDDPAKGKAEARSETIQEQIRDWYTGSAYTRLAPGGGVLMIMQRWADDDLAGWLLAEDAAKPENLRENWEVIRYASIAEEDEKYRKKGEALHPERYPIDILLKIRATLGEYDFSALFQQNPLPEVGDYFKEEDFKYYDPTACPPLNELNVYAAWDLAIKETESADESVGFYVGVDTAGIIYVLHVEATRANSLKLAEIIFDLNDTFHPINTGFEKGHIEGTMGPFLNQMMLDRKTFFPYEALPVGNQDKAARATTTRGLMQQGRFLWRKHDSAQAASKSQMLKFPNAKHDDHVDAAAHIGRMIDGIVAKRIATQKKNDTWRDKFVKKMVRQMKGGGKQYMST